MFIVHETAFWYRVCWPTCEIAHSNVQWLFIHLAALCKVLIPREVLITRDWSSTKCRKTVSNPPLRMQSKLSKNCTVTGKENRGSSSCVQKYCSEKNFLPQDRTGENYIKRNFKKNSSHVIPDLMKGWIGEARLRKSS